MKEVKLDKVVEPKKKDVIDEEKAKLLKSIGLLILLVVVVIGYDMYNFSKIEDSSVEYRNGLEELMSHYPNGSIFIIGIFVSFFSSLTMKLFLNQEHLKKLKKKQKDLQKELKECQKSGDSCKAEKLNSEMMKVSTDMMKSSFSIKQFVVTLVPFLILFNCLRGVYIDADPPIFTYGGFLLRYMVAVLVSSSVYKKILNLA